LDVFGLHQILEKPTRVTKSSKTLIDHLITNFPQRIADTGIIPCSIVSDHDGIYASINVRVPRFEARHKYIRDIKSLNESLFIEDFSTLPLSVIAYSDDPDEQLESLTSLFVECLERHAPLRRVRVTRPPAPWMKSPNIQTLQKERDNLRYKAHKSDADNGVWAAFRLVRNNLKSAIRSARKAFIEKALSSNKSRDVWRVIHRILKPNPKSLRVDPDELNTHFATTAERTLEASAVSLSDLTSLTDNLPEQSSNGDQFNLKPVTQEDVFKCIRSLRSDCSTGVDNIPARFVKLVAQHLACPLTSIINKCISNAYFPKLWKIARFSPIPKVENPTSNDQLRPISILPVLSKVFEKLVAGQMSEFAERAALLPDRISGFRKGHSTTSVLLGIRDDIRHAMKKGEITLMVLADFSKAFDTICFKSTIEKFLSWASQRPS
jgi:hypothetical protein